MTDTPSVAGEDAVDLPESWAAELLDRRGRRAPRPVEIEPDAVSELQALFAQHGKALEKALARLEDPSYEATIRAGIAGNGDPLETALALRLLARVSAKKYYNVIDATKAWIAGRGVVFAAEAVIELASHVAAWYDYRRNVKSPVIVRPAEVAGLFRSAETVRYITPLRSILAGLPDDEYEAVRAAVERRRTTTDAHRFASAMLMPEQEAWVREAMQLYAAKINRWSATDSLWIMASSKEHLAIAGVTKLDRYYADNHGVAHVVDALGAESLPFLVATLDDDDERPSAEFRDSVYDVLGRLPSEDAIALLIERSNLPQATAALKAAAARFPVRTLRAVAAQWTAVSASLKARLAGLVLADLADRVPDLEEADRSRLEELLQSVRRVPPAASLPPVFAAPPWAPFKPSAKRASLGGLTPPETDELHWAEGERQAWAEGTGSAYGGHHYLRSEQFWRRSHWNWRTIATDHYYFVLMLAWAPDDLALAGYKRWEGAADGVPLPAIRAILARYGEDAAPRIQDLIGKKPSYRPALLPFVNLDAARMAASWVSRSRTDREHGRAWLDRHPDEAAAFLIPDALGKSAKERQSAADALRFLAAEHRESLDKAAAAYGPEAAEAVGAIVDADPLDPRRRVPKPAAWADPALLPPVLLEGRRERLPDDAVKTLMTALALDDPERLYPGADLLVAECDPVSAAAFSWSLFELWIAAGSPTKDGWAMDQLRRFADDGTVRRLTALIREWPGQSQNRKAVRGLEILGHIGSEAALRAVQSIAANGRFKSLKKTAAAQIEVIAERLELTLDQLADRLVPDFGLSSDAPLVLDYGPRSFTVKFDEQLKPYVVDGAGKRRASAPKPAAKDDEELARAAHERYAALRKELKSTAAEQVKRLEAAMVDQRAWSPAEFKRHLVDHPVMWQLAHRLVFQATGGGAPKSFRLAEDRTLADLDDEQFDLPEDAAVRIAHPLTLGGEVDDWATVFADYEILQPFDQLARPVLTLTDEERATGRLARFEGVKTGAGPIIGLLKRGWQYGAPDGSRYNYCIYRTFPEGGWLLLDPNPGVHPGYGDDGEQVLREVAFALPEDGAVDPVRLSEAIAVVARLTRSA